MKSARRCFTPTELFPLTRKKKITSMNKYIYIYNRVKDLTTTTTTTKTTTSTTATTETTATSSPKYVIKI